MTSVRAKFRASKMNSTEGSIYYQITHERKVRQLLTAYKIRQDEWDAHRSIVIRGYDVGRHEYILSVRTLIIRDLERITRIVRRLETTRLVYSVDDVVDEFVCYKSQYTLIKFMGDVIRQLRGNSQFRTAETYTAALNSFKRFLVQSGRICQGCDDVMLDCMDSDLMKCYEAWLNRRGVLPNTVSFYNRILRAVYNRAVDLGVIENRRPFRHVYTGVDKTTKRALPLTVIRKIVAMNLSGLPDVDYARDMFVLSFYLRGMSFVDMAFLRKSDLRHGYLTYRRRKTGQMLTIAWTKEMQRILDKYSPNPTCYLLPIIVNASRNERSIYRNRGYTINRNLKKVAAMIGVSHQSLTLYCARHSWASVAHNKGIPISVISEGLGHESESTTRIYLSSLDTSVVDRANSLILSAL